MRASEPVARIMFFASTVFLRAVLGRDLDLAAAFQLRPAFDDLYLVLPHQHLDALRVLADDLVLAIVYLAPVEARIIAEDAFVAGVNEVVPDVGSVEECFGGNATDKKAGSAEPRLLFYERGLQAVLASANCSRVPARPATDDDQVVCHSFDYRSILHRFARSEARQTTERMFYTQAQTRSSRADACRSSSIRKIQIRLILVRDMALLMRRKSLEC